MNFAEMDPEKQREIARKGFANMDPEKHREIARKGGKAAQRGVMMPLRDGERPVLVVKAHRWNEEEARAAGRKGGATTLVRKKAKKAIEGQV